VGVHGDPGVGVGGVQLGRPLAEHHVGGLSGHAGQGDEVGHAQWDLAVEALEQRLAHAAHGLGLLAEEAGRLEDLLQLLLGGRHEVGRPGVLREQPRRHLVDLLVR
jgi:hypothetical protein